MTRKEAVKALLDLVENVDTEGAHERADAVLCDLLKSLGYEDVVKAFGAIQKWYA